jgi:hypothetical protein
MKSMWDDRYQQEAYAYGKAPNKFLASRLATLPPGKILLAAEGEGRNAVFAARCGWETHAFDQSSFGKEKALRLAEEYDVAIRYEVADCLTVNYPLASFDAIGLIYAHFPAPIKSACHQRLMTFLKPGGTIIFEAFSKKHPAYQSIYPRVGGPTDPDMLFSLEEIAEDFAGLDMIECRETETELDEGIYHIGKGSVIRFKGIKKIQGPISS